MKVLRPRARAVIVVGASCGCMLGTGSVASCAGAACAWLAFGSTGSAVARRTLISSPLVAGCRSAVKPLVSGEESRVVATGP